MYQCMCVKQNLPHCVFYFSCSSRFRVRKEFQNDIMTLWYSHFPFVEFPRRPLCFCGFPPALLFPPLWSKPPCVCVRLHRCTRLQTRRWAFGAVLKRSHRSLLISMLSELQRRDAVLIWWTQRKNLSSEWRCVGGSVLSVRLLLDPLTSRHLRPHLSLKHPSVVWLDSEAVGHPFCAIHSLSSYLLADITLWYIHIGNTI